MLIIWLVMVITQGIRRIVRVLKKNKGMIMRVMMIRKEIDIKRILRKRRKKILRRNLIDYCKERRVVIVLLKRMIMIMG